MTIVNNDLPDIQFSLSDDNGWSWSNPKVKIDWWYITYEEDSPYDEDEDPFRGHKEGVYLSFTNGNEAWGVSLSTETVVDMLRTLAERITGSKSISLALAEAPDRGLRRVE